MPSRPQLQIAIGLAALTWAVLLIINGVAVKLAWLRPYGLVVGLVTVAFVAFDKWLWRLGPIKRVAKRQVVHGTWKGRLTSTWKRPEGNLEPIPVYLVVRQTYSTVVLTFLTAESKSVSLVSALDVSAPGSCVLLSTYVNTPRLLLQDRSRIHRGAMILEVHGAPPRSLEGFYWTDRDTKGEIILDAYSRELYSDFKSAEAGQYFAS